MLAGLASTVDEPPIVGESACSVRQLLRLTHLRRASAAGWIDGALAGLQLKDRARRWRLIYGRTFSTSLCTT